MKLIPDWKDAWKFASVWLTTVGIVLSSAVEIVSTAWKVLPSHLASKLPGSTSVAIVFMGLALIGRILSFKDSSEETDGKHE